MTARLKVRPGTDQQLQGFQLAVSSGEVEHGVALRVARVGIGAAVGQQAPHVSRALIHHHGAQDSVAQSLGAQQESERKDVLYLGRHLIDQDAPRVLAGRGVGHVKLPVLALAMLLVLLDEDGAESPPQRLDVAELVPQRLACAPNGDTRQQSRAVRWETG